MSAAVLEVRGVDKSFGVKVVDRVDLTVGPADAVGIVGPNGAGKTTLMNLIAGDLRVDAGTIRFAGRDVTRMRADRRCRLGLARTSQIPRPFEGMTAFENVLVAASYGRAAPVREAKAVEQAVDALRTAGLLALANRPAGSLGLLHRKRLELARALATEPALLLLDEIAGGLTESEVVELVDTIGHIHAGGVPIVWIEHIVHALLAVVDRIVAMSFGRKIAEGDPAEVMASPEVREVYLGMEPTA